ncbi:aldehyde dehydrogenase family protein [Allorhizocola rhizosphaerae]|uniref:aldehyde dehydrogenase family protein n=1 Tax=Allorhizocola rhizosphaerae TaxID=1872709 RepID=UPI001B8B8BC4|nr:aldehyde dehydrogenase family protein [Allorhizocola rhizosphaerae]
MTSRIEVRKTLKLYIGGAFPRSESGRTFEVDGHNAALASRKDARDAVLAARAAFGKWTGATAYNRGQILYRAAEMGESRGVGASDVDRLVWYAGWADKIAQVIGNANPVAGPYFNLSSPEPTGVVGVIGPSDLVEAIASVIVTGNTCVVVTPRAVEAVFLAEVFATSDLPGGVVNILTGYPKEVGPWLASHDDVNALDLSGLDDAELAKSLEEAASDTLKRVLRPLPVTGMQRMTAFLETKTVWHPKGV